MKWIHLLLVVLAFSACSCETLKLKGAHGKNAKGEEDQPTSLADIDVSDLPPEYTTGMRPVVAYYVDEMSNSQFAFDDEIGDYRVKLFPDHTYSFTATAKDKSRSTTKGGLWKWHRVGPDQGFLMLDNRRWFLGFTSLDEAKATTKGDQRSFMLKFSHL